MLSIVYSSTAVEPFSPEQLAELLVRSRAANERLGLTGLLVHRGGRFLQLLEGPDRAVIDRMAAIEHDPRHGAVRVLLEDGIDERRFPEWTMGYEAPATVEGAPGHRRTFDDLDADQSTSGTLPALRELLRWFRAQHDER